MTDPAPGPALCRDCPVAERAVCAALPLDARERLARSGRRRQFARGDTLIAPDDADRHWATLLSGAAKIVAIDADGRERILGLVHPAGMVGQLFTAAPGQHVVALTHSEACVFPRATVEALSQAEPRLAGRLLEEIVRELDASRALLELIGGRDARARVAGLLLSFARAASPFPCHDAQRFALPLTRGEIAALLGLTIETVSRTLTAFEREGLMTRAGTHDIVVDDAVRLAAAAGAATASG